MSTEFVHIGCRLPNGLTIECGYETNVRGAGGAPFARYRKLSDYQAFTLKGINQHSFLRDLQGKVMSAVPSARDRPAYINTNVPKALWDRWTAEHKDSWLLTSGQLFVVPKPADAKAVTADANAKSRAIFEPLDPGVPMKIDSMEIQRRSDDYDL